MSAEHFVARSAADRLKVAENWFETRPCADGIVHIREAWVDPYLTGDMWLVRGRDRALLVDSGTGIVSPRALVEELAGNPVLAVACNCWYDHAGGLHAFAQRGCHRGDAEFIAAPTAESSVASIYVSDEMLTALPCAGYSTDNFRMTGTLPTLLLEEGDVIDLGDRRIEILHVPGVTPGSIALWEKATGSLFTSDTLFDDPAPQLRAKYHATIAPPRPEVRAQRIADLKRLSELPVKTVYAGHFGRIGRGRMLELISAY